jgi:acetylornithine deacetylase/succinyl-diaminopimelate desuccinylase-like protein
MRRWFWAALAASLTLPATAQTLRPDQLKFRALYKELVETNTTLSSGSCTLAAQKMAAHLKAAGYPDSDLHLFSVSDHPKEGGLVAVLHGSDPKAKAVLLLGHLDVVEAKREDWTRDPFKLIEEGGYFYGRGTSDMKGQSAVWVDIMIRFRQENFRPRRSVKLALTCGEETSYAFNGARYLAAHERQLIDAGIALNEGAGGRLDASGKHLLLNIQAGEKFPQNYKLEVTNVGGHSSRPTPDNAIYHLAFGLTKISAYKFPVESNDATRQFFAAMGPLTGGKLGAAMSAFAKNPKDDAAAAVIAADPGHNAILHTTCIPTLLNAGGRPPNQGHDPGKTQRCAAQPDAADTAGHGPDKGRCRQDMAGCGRCAGHAGRGHGRGISQSCRHSHLWTERHVRRSRWRRRPWP